VDRKLFSHGRRSRSTWGGSTPVVNDSKKVPKRPRRGLKTTAKVCGFLCPERLQTEPVAEGGSRRVHRWGMKSWKVYKGMRTPCPNTKMLQGRRQVQRRVSRKREGNCQPTKSSTRTTKKLNARPGEAQGFSYGGGGGGRRRYLFQGGPRACTKPQCISITTKRGTSQ